MTAIFENVITVLQQAEGTGTSDLLGDRGGITSMGISQAAFPELNVATLSYDEKIKLYETKYWNAHRLSELNDQTIANQCFLLIINLNPSQAVKIIQTAINVCGQRITTVIVDGIMGNDTIVSLNSLNHFYMSAQLRIEAIRYYLKLTDDDRSQGRFLRSWIRRTLL